MKLYALCEGCNKKRFFIRKRVYSHKIAGIITSKSLLCRKCYKNINKMLVM